MKFYFLIAITVCYFLYLVKGCIYKGLECPEYEVISENDDYEIRSYQPMVWATTSDEDELYETASYVLFMRLFNYGAGGNENGRKISMTVPIRTLVPDADDDNKTLEMSFFIPSALSENPPQPNDGNITIRRETSNLYAVRRFSGYAITQKTWEDEAKILRDVVENDPKIDTSYYYIVGYDAPMTFHDRRNEIWMILKEK